MLVSRTEIDAARSGRYNSLLFESLEHNPFFVSFGKVYKIQL